MNLEENCNQCLYRDNIYQLRNKRRQQKLVTIVLRIKFPIQIIPHIVILAKYFFSKKNFDAKYLPKF